MDCEEGEESKWLIYYNITRTPYSIT